MFIGKKTIHRSIKGRLSVDWLRNFFDKQTGLIGYLRLHRNDIQNKDAVFVTSNPSQSDFNKHEVARVTKDNLVKMCIYYSIRQSVEATWLNDRDQFLYPNDGWQNDTQFQNDCFAYTLFSNNIQSQYAINDWIPFTEQEVKARTKFDSNFMTQFIAGKLKQEKPATLFDTQEQRTTPLIFSAQAQAVFSSGLALWQYYHHQPNCNVNASLYDIREHFQGRNATGKMNNKSDDATYMGLIKNLREQLKLLQKNIEPKVYEYGFLK